MHRPQVLGERIALYRRRAQAGADVRPMQVAVARKPYVADDRADAEAALVKQAA